MADPIDNLEKSVRKLQKAFHDGKITGEQFMKGVEKLGKTARDLGKSADISLKIVDSLDKKFRAGRIDAASYAESLKKIGENAKYFKVFEDARRKMEALHAAYGDGKDPDKYSKETKKLANELAATQKGFKGLGDALEKVTGVFGNLKTAGAAALGALAIPPGFKELQDILVKYNKTLYDTSRISRVTGQDYGKIQKATMELKNESMKLLSMPEAASIMSNMVSKVQVGFKTSASLMSKFAGAASKEFVGNMDAINAAMDVVVNVQNQGGQAFENLGKAMPQDALDAYRIRLEKQYGLTQDQINVVMRLYDVMNGPGLDDNQKRLIENEAAMKELDAAWQDAKVTLAKALAPHIKEMNELLIKLVGWLTQVAGSDWFAKVAKIAMYVGPALALAGAFNMVYGSLKNVGEMAFGVGKGIWGVVKGAGSLFGMGGKKGMPGGPLGAGGLGAGGAPIPVRVVNYDGENLSQNMDKNMDKTMTKSWTMGSKILTGGVMLGIGTLADKLGDQIGGLAGKGVSEAGGVMQAAGAGMMVAGPWGAVAAAAAKTAIDLTAAFNDWRAAAKDAEDSWNRGREQSKETEQRLRSTGQIQVKAEKEYQEMLAKRDAVEKANKASAEAQQGGTGFFESMWHAVVGVNEAEVAKFQAAAAMAGREAIEAQEKFKAANKAAGVKYADTGPGAAGTAAGAKPPEPPPKPADVAKIDLVADFRAAAQMTKIVKESVDSIVGSLEAQRNMALKYNYSVQDANRLTQEELGTLNKQLDAAKKQAVIAAKVRAGLSEEKDGMVAILSADRDVADATAMVATLQAKMAETAMQTAQNLQKGVEVIETQVGLMEAQYSLAKSMYLGLGPQMQMQSKIVEKLEEEKNQVQAQYEAMDQIRKAHPENIDAQQKAIEYQTKLVQLTQKQFDLVKGLREGYLDAISSFTNVQGAFGKVMTKQDQGMGIMIRQMKAASSMRGGGKGGFDTPFATLQAGTGQMTVASSEATKRVARGRGAPADYSDMQDLAARGARVTAAGAMQGMSQNQREAMMYGGAGGGVIGAGAKGAAMTPEQRIAARGTVPGAGAGMTPGAGAEGKEKSDWVKTIAEGINASALVKAGEVVKAGAAATIPPEVKKAEEVAKKAKEVAEATAGSMEAATAAVAGPKVTTGEYSYDATKEKEEKEKARRDALGEKGRAAEDEAEAKKKAAEEKSKNMDKDLIRRVDLYSKAMAHDRVGGRGHASEVNIGKRGAPVAAPKPAETHAALAARRAKFEEKQAKEENERIARQKKLIEMADKNAPKFDLKGGRLGENRTRVEGLGINPDVPHTRKELEGALKDKGATGEIAKNFIKNFYEQVGGAAPKPSGITMGGKEWSPPAPKGLDEQLAQLNRIGDAAEKNVDVSKEVAVNTKVGTAAGPAKVDVSPIADNMMGGPIRYAPGGKVPVWGSGSGSTNADSVPALLMPGEFVINKRNAQKFGPLLEAMNSNRFADGGMVGPSAALARSSGGRGGGGGGGAPQISISVKGDTVGKIMKSVNQQLSSQLNHMLTPCGTTGRSFERGH